MMDLKLNSDHDVYLDGSHPATVEDTEGDPAETAQAAKVTFKAQQGEWTFDTDLGLPYLEEIFIKNPDFDAIGATIRAVGGSILNVQRVTKVAVEVDPITRRMIGAVELETSIGPATVEFT